MTATAPSAPIRGWLPDCLALIAILAGALGLRRPRALLAAAGLGAGIVLALQAATELAFRWGSDVLFG